MVKEDFIARNWEFFSQRKHLDMDANRLLQLTRNGQVPLSGKFFGTVDFFENFPTLTAITASGSRRLLLKPYIVAPMPEPTIQAIYIDAKRYRFSADGVVEGLDTTYELPFVIFR